MHLLQNQQIPFPCLYLFTDHLHELFWIIAVRMFAEGAGDLVATYIHNDPTARAKV